MLDPLRLSSGLLLPQPLLDVMKKLHDIYGSALVVTSLNPRGATIEVRGLTSEVLIRTMMARKAEIFAAEIPAGGGCVLGPGDFQVLAPLGTRDSALTLRYLPNFPDPGEYRSGFWYY